MLRSLSRTEREALVERIERTDSRYSVLSGSTDRSVERLGADRIHERTESSRVASSAIERLLTREGGERSVERSASSRLERTLERSHSTSSTASVKALVGEAGTERLLTVERVREIALASGGDSTKAAMLARQHGEKLDRPEIRDLVAGDVVIPDRKLFRFFEGLIPKAKAASGGLVPLQAMDPITRAVGDATGEGGVEVNFNLTQMNGPPVEVRNQRVRRSGARVDIFGELWVAEVRRGGQGDREMSRKYALQPQLRDPG